MCFYCVNDDVLFVVCIILYIFWQIKTIKTKQKNFFNQIILLANTYVENSIAESWQ